MTRMASAGLRLQAQDADDLSVLSAALQDAIARLADLDYRPRERAFVALVTRFAWERAAAGRPGLRVRAALRIDGVLGARVKGLDLRQPETMLALLALAFAPGGEPPGGELRLVFAGGGEVALEVECVEALLMDLSRPWPAGARPEHEEG